MLITLLVAVIVIGLIAWLVQYLPIAEPFKSIAMVVLILIAIFYLLGYVK